MCSFFFQRGLRPRRPRAAPARPAPQLNTRRGPPGARASLAPLPATAVLTLVLPNFTTSLPGPVYNPSQLAFIAVISLVLYGTFALVQTVRHRDYFLPAEAATDATAHAAVSYTHLRAHETVLDLVCRLLLEKKKNHTIIPSQFAM